jgi:hypothetical protein
MTGDKARECAGARRGVTTYQEAAAGNFADQRDRFHELDDQDLMARSLAKLQAQQAYDPGRHPGPAEYPPLTVDEHLEVLALGEAIARFYRHPAHVHQAVLAGTTWPQAAAALGSSEKRVRADYRAWAARQRRLHQEYGGNSAWAPANTPPLPHARGRGDRHDRLLLMGRPSRAA